MKLLSLHTLWHACSAMLLAGTLQATEIKDKVQAGDRCLSKAEYAAIQEGRALEAKKFEKIKDNLISEAQKAKDALKNAIKISGDTASAPLTSLSAMASVYYTTHQGAFHQPMAVSFFGDYVTLEDGSEWAVNPGDTYKTLNWLTSDIILIMPNYTWFSSFNYKFINQATGVSVEVNLRTYINPLLHSVYNHRVVAIDDILQMIWLEDGSAWSISSSDYSEKWQINDTVIIGLNDGWQSSSKPNILINANLLHYVRANCVY